MDIRKEGGVKYLYISSLDDIIEYFYYWTLTRAALPILLFLVIFGIYKVM